MPLEEKRNTDRNTVNPNAPLHKFDQFKVLDNSRGNTRVKEIAHSRILLNEKESMIMKNIG